MSLAERLLWRFQSPLGRILAVLNRLPIGERPVTVGGDRLYAASADRWLAAMGWKLGLLERAERRLIARELAPGMVAVDVGANLGLHTLAMARRVGREARVYALEPDPVSFRLLSRAVAEAGAPQVRLIQAAASDAAGEAHLYRSAVSAGEHGLYPLAGSPDSVSVRTLTLDDLLRDEPRVDFVKLDAQGAEVAALRGLARTLARSPSIRVLCELCPAALARAGNTVDELLAILSDARLAPHALAPDGMTPPMSAVEARATAAHAGYVNLLFSSPSSRVRI